MHGPEGLREFTNTKAVMSSRVTGPRELWWFPVPKGLDAMGIRSMRLRFGSNLATKATGLRRRG